MNADRMLPAERHRILHLSDTHLTGSGFDEDGVAAATALERILYDARFVPGIDLIVVTGDIADDGSIEGFASVLERVGRFAGERGIPHIYCTGNHDAREAFAAVFGTGHLGSDGSDVGQLAQGVGDERAAVSDVCSLRVITLDSLVSGSVHGFVSDAQLAWLRSVLAQPAAAGSVVVLHHPPIALESSPLMKSVNLQNARQLADALSGTDVHAVLCGHFHLQLSGSLNGTCLDRLTTRLWRVLKRLAVSAWHRARTGTDGESRSKIRTTTASCCPAVRGPTSSSHPATRSQNQCASTISSPGLADRARRVIRQVNARG